MASIAAVSLPVQSGRDSSPTSMSCIDGLRKSFQLYCLPTCLSGFLILVSNSGDKKGAKPCVLRRQEAPEEDRKPSGHSEASPPPELPTLAVACHKASESRGRLVLRSLYVSWRLLPLSISCLVDLALPGGPRWSVRNARRFRLALEALGPAFVKLGQAVAAREDILREDVAAELRKLCDQVAPFPCEEAQRVLKEELGVLAPELPGRSVAAASLGQVYQIQVDGKKYALKVQRPGLPKALAVDIVILQGLARLLNKPLRRFSVAAVDLSQVVHNWATTLWEELDYMHEARMMEDMRSQLRRRISGLCIPDVNWTLTATRVLATTWVDGTKVSDCPSRIQEVHVQVGVEAFAAMVLDLGVVHADPHAGNLLVSENNDLVLLDFGMVIHIPEAHRIAWAWTFVSIVRGDYEQTLDGLIDIGFFPRNCQRDKILPVMSKIWRELVASGSSTKKRRDAVMQLYGEILTLARTFEYNLPDYYVALVRALLTLEGLALCANHEFDIFKVVFPVALRRVAATATSSAAESAKRFLRLPSCSQVAAAAPCALLAGTMVFGAMLASQEGLALSQR